MYRVETFENGTWVEVFVNVAWDAARNFFWKKRKEKPGVPWRVVKGEMLCGNYDPKWKIKV